MWDLGSATGDHVQESASGDPQQQKQLQDPQQQKQGIRKLLEMSKSLLLHIALDCDTLLMSTSASAYELLRGNIIRVGAERFRCTELTTNLYRASTRICTTMSRRSMTRTRSKGLMSARFCSCNGECRSQFGRKACPS